MRMRIKAVMMTLEQIVLQNFAMNIEGKRAKSRILTWIGL